jgi:hypothetical protein
MSNQDDGFATAIVALFQLVFSLTFPLMFITLCGVSYVLTDGLHLGQFGLWAWVAGQAVADARTTPWVALALIAFIIAAVPLAWIAFREHATRASGVIGAWVGAAIFCGATLWLASAWSFDYSAMQQYVFAFALLAAWFALCDALMTTLKLVAMNRPQPGPEVVMAQKAHGDARVAGEAEALSLLNSKK